MAAIITRRKWTRQPGAFVDVDLGNPLWDGGARFYTYGAITHDLVTRQVGTVSGVIPIGGQTGIVELVGTSGGNTNGISWPSTSAYDLTGPFTAFIRLIRNANTSSSYDRVFSRQLDAGANGKYGFLLSNTTGGVNSLYWEQHEGGSSITTPFNTQSAVSNTQYETYILVNDGSNLLMYRNGVLATTTAAVGLYPTAGQSLTLNIGNVGNGGIVPYDGAPVSIEFIGATLGAWNAAQVADFTQQSYQIVKPRTRRLYFGASGGTSFSGTPGLGSLVKTGKINALTIGYKFVPAVGSLVKTGEIPTLTRAFNFAPGAGSLVKTGEIPTLTRRFYFAPGAGSIPKTGEIPSLTIGYYLQPSAGSMVKTGHAPLLYAPFHPGAGSIVKTGHIPILTISGGTTTGQSTHSWFVKGIGVKTKIGVNSQVDSDSGDTP